MGMLMSAAYILAMDTFGPITDNAGGITEISGAPESARQITDTLDAVGNTTKALTKGYAVASAGLAAFLLFSAYLDKVKERLEMPLTAELPIDLANVDVFVGGLLGVMLVFLFSSLAIRVGRQRRRRDHRRGAAPVPRGPRHHGRHVAPRLRPRRRHHGAAALRAMIAPGLLAVGMPIAGRPGLPLCAWPAVHAGDHDTIRAGWPSPGLLIVGTIGGILVATVLNNGGGAWDNAKKFIEAGELKDETGNVLGKGTPSTRPPSSATPSATPSRTPPAPRCTCWSSCWHDHAGAGAAVHRQLTSPPGPLSARRRGGGEREGGERASVNKAAPRMGAALLLFDNGGR